MYRECIQVKNVPSVEFTQILQVINFPPKSSFSRPRIGQSHSLFGQNTRGGWSTTGGSTQIHVIIIIEKLRSGRICKVYQSLVFKIPKYLREIFTFTYGIKDTIYGRLSCDLTEQIVAVI